MVRTGGSVVIRHVAARARSTRQTVVIVLVAQRALQGNMRSGQGKACTGMVKGRVSPSGRIVARLACLRESSRPMGRIGRLLEIRHMAGRTGPARQAVIAVLMTLRALQRYVRARKRKARAGMVEGRIPPRSRVMARLASVRERCLPMVGISRLLIVRHVAGRTSSAAQREIAILVALRARQAGMRSG